MKSRELRTIHDLIATNYRLTPCGDGKFLHEFTPSTTKTVYQFEGNGVELIEEGQRYNIGYFIDSNGDNIIEPSALSKTVEVNPMFSFAYAQQLAKENHVIEKDKNDTRVTHSATDGYYWGKKYAWRMFGTVISDNAFFKYLKEIGHPKISCITNNPDLQYSSDPSTAYKEEGLEEAVRNLISTAEKVSPAYFKSPLYSKKFSIRGIKAISDKK
ncbi:hypothetical protein KO527_10725 [Pseudoalteromonas sp. C2R02]|uniref:hypothetical protein n=1 Tax=Pseudoalteromonas sp. C2R02 TaxID=2841565 RepID=UPI001C080288|nr:hypothetical protein [Pseudoalteromonas sp. C2R02]MBU2969820.1 hypothetical protein [Pseudoalteromonas sp. C2R02]